MAKCDVCGEQVDMPYQCRHCGGTYCSSHRLPENHDCPGLADWGDPDGVFDSGFDDSVVDSGGESGGFADRLTAVGGPLGYFRGNMTFVFLGLMWVVFGLQFAVRLALTPQGSLDMTFASYQTYRSIFVLAPQHPEYVWTWITAIFAHGGLYHIALNSIVIYFFGRLVEQYVGSKEFTALFLVSGALAGLSQIAIQILQGPITPITPGVLGASGAGLAIMGVLTVLNPNLRVYLYFILPIPIWVLTIGYAAISILAILGPGVGAGGVAQMAHLVGLAIGLVYGQHVKRRGISAPNQLQFGGGGPGGPGGPGGGRRRGPF